MDVVKELHYRKLREIGVGQGMNSVVYEAEDTGVGRIVAVKEIQKANLSAQGVLDYFAEAKRMFSAQHENVVPILAAASCANEVVLMMPLYRQGSLADRIADGPLSLRETQRIGQGVLQGLSRIHIADLLHFDVKPSNVLFNDAGKPMVSDFGQARQMGGLGTAPAPRMYPYVVPPEILKVGIATTRSDVFQAGLTLYRVVNGEPFYQDVLKRQIGHFAGDLRACLSAGALVDTGAYMPHVPPGLRRVINRALSVEPGQRYGTATEFSDALGRVPAVLDWHVTANAPGTIWTAARKGQPSLVVQMLPSAKHPGRTDVTVHTKRGTDLRAHRRNEFWEEGLTERQAADHLKRTVFAQLWKGTK